MNFDDYLVDFQRSMKKIGDKSNLGKRYVSWVCASNEGELANLLDNNKSKSEDSSFSTLVELIDVRRLEIKVRELLSKDRYSDLEAKAFNEGLDKEFIADFMVCLAVYESCTKSWAPRTFRMFKNKSVIEVAAELTSRTKKPMGYSILEKNGLVQYSFESLALRHKIHSS